MDGSNGQRQFSPRSWQCGKRGPYDADGPPGAGISKVIERAPLVPPHWSHQRHESYISIDEGMRSPPIILEDNTGEGSERSSSCWARRVSIDDYVLVSGSVPSVGTFVVWNCKVDTLDVSLPSSGLQHIKSPSQCFAIQCDLVLT